MKKCNKCGIEATIEEAQKTFVLHEGCTDGIRPMCLSCKRKEEAEHRLRLRKDEEYKVKERESNRNRRAKYYKENIAKIKNYLGDVKCSICGYTDDCFAPFDFHHKDPSTKEFGIHKKIDISPFENWKAEVDKCMLVCSNCHRKIHSKRCNKHE
jgi:hypothetical protein